MGTPSSTAATRTCRCRGVSAVRIPSRTASSSSPYSASSSGPGPAWARVSQCSGSRVTSRSRQARRRTFTAASSSANLYAHVRKLLSPRKSSNRRRTESAASSAESWASSSSSTAESWGSAAPPEHLEAGRPQEQPMEMCHSRLAACAFRLQVEVPLLDTRGCRQCAHIRISVRRGHGLTFYRRDCALRGGKGGGPRRHFAVLLGDPALGMRRPANGDAPVPNVDVGVVILALGQLRKPVDEGDRGRERGQLELPRQGLVLLRPVAQ